MQQTGKEKGIMRVRYIHLIGKPRYIGKEVAEVLEEVAEDTEGNLMQKMAFGHTGVGGQEFTPKHEDDLAVRLQRYNLSDVSRRSGIPLRTLQNINNLGVKPQIKTESILEKALENYA